MEVTIKLWSIIDLIVHFGLLILIWLVQVIIYPSFRHTDSQAFMPWHAKYMRLITYFVLPLMVVQLILSIGQVYPSYFLNDVIVLMLVIAVWLFTFFLSVPCHHQLLLKKDATAIERLITTNWYRTICWSVVFMIEIFRLM